MKPGNTFCCFAHLKVAILIDPIKQTCKNSPFLVGFRVSGLYWLFRNNPSAVVTGIHVVSGHCPYTFAGVPICGKVDVYCLEQWVPHSSCLQLDHMWNFYKDKNRQSCSQSFVVQNIWKPCKTHLAETSVYPYWHKSLFTIVNVPPISWHIFYFNFNEPSWRKSYGIILFYIHMVCLLTLI